MNELNKKSSISHRKYNFLNRFKSTLSEKELKELQEYTKIQQRENLERGKLYIANARKEAEPKPKIESIDNRVMKKLFVKNWESLHKEKFVIRNKDEAEFYKAIIRYFAKDTKIQGQEFDFAKMPIDLDKGLLILGGYGTGKTSMMLAFEKIGNLIYRKYTDYFLWFVTSNCVEMLYEFENADTDRGDFMSKYSVAHRFIDDLGRERDASKFGKLNLMAEVLENRLNSSAYKTYITSNLKFSELENRYGGAVFSRMHERLNVLVMDGDDRRKI